MTWTNLGRAGGKAVLLMALVAALPALAKDAGGPALDSIITPGFGTLGSIFDWLRQLFS